MELSGYWMHMVHCSSELFIFVNYVAITYVGVHLIRHVYDHFNQYDEDEM